LTAAVNRFDGLDILVDFSLSNKARAILLTIEKLTAEFPDFINSLSHRPGIADILIAATALYYDLPIYTQNRKHFAFIPGIRLI
jgi:predicted nucleic acid-binding protein